MGPTLPAVGYKKQSFGNKFGQALGAASEAYNEYQENEALKSKGIDLKGIKDPNTRAQLIAHELKQGQAAKRANATRDLGVEPVAEQGTSSSRDYKEKQKKNSPKETEVEEIIPSQKAKKQKTQEREEPAGLYPQRQFQGPLQPVLSPQQVEQQGRQFAAEANRREPGANITDEEGIQIANDRNNQRMAHNQNIKNEEEELQKMKSGLNAKGQAQAAALIPGADLKPEVMTQFGKEAEELGNLVNSEAELDKEMAKKINSFNDTMNSIRKHVPAYRGSPTAKGSRLTDKDASDIREKIKPLLDLGFYGSARKILSEKGYGLEETESIVSSLSEQSTKVLSQIPKLREVYEFPNPVEMMGTRGIEGMRRNREYSPDQKEVINNSIKQVFEKDPNTNLVLLRKEMREKKNIDWMAYKDALDYAMTTGTLQMNPEQRQHFDNMNEPELGPLDEIMYYFTGKGK